MFLAFVFTAFYSLVNPARGLQIWEDHNIAESHRQALEVKQRILGIKRRQKERSGMVDIADTATDKRLDTKEQLVR